MKKIQSILVIALGVCAMLTSCQELDTPINNIPTIETGEATEITATSALLSFKSENGKADCSLVYILSTSPDMNDFWQSESNYIKDLIPNPTYYYLDVIMGYKRQIERTDTGCLYSDATYYGTCNIFHNRYSQCTGNYDYHRLYASQSK